MKKRTFKSVFIMLLTLVCMFVMPVMSASADDLDAKSDPTGYMESYITNGGGVTVISDNQNKTYPKEGGGSYKYSELVDDGYVNGNFTELTSKGKESLLTDMNTYAESAVKENSNITNQTKTTWLTNLQQCNGVGTQLMNTILQNTKPDYATANRIYEPFSGIVGTCLALGAILIMAFLGITMVLDLSYIGIPAFRMMVGGDDKGGKDGKPKFISWEAVSAVTQAEGGNGGSGQDGSGNKVAVGIYFKKRVIMLIVLGVCLLYLISGQIYTLVSWILDLVSGFLGF